jgi:hypothetical protein
MKRVRMFIADRPHIFFHREETLARSQRPSWAGRRRKNGGGKAVY